MRSDKVDYGKICNIIDLQHAIASYNCEHWPLVIGIVHGNAALEEWGLSFDEQAL